MKTLILYASPHKTSHTYALLEPLIKEISGEIIFFDCYKEDVKPCVDCKYCYKFSGCSIKDSMQKLYDIIETCDAIVIASPMHFGSVSAPLFSVISRLQTYWSSTHIRNIDNNSFIKQPKYGALLVTAGGSWPNMNLVLDGIAEFAFDHMQTDCIGSVYAKKTDKIAVKDNKYILDKSKELGKRLNTLLTNPTDN